MSPPLISGLNGLVNLTRLNLSYNQIKNLTGEFNTNRVFFFLHSNENTNKWLTCQCCWLGLLYLHGLEYKLKQISLHSNHLDSIDHLLQCLLGLQGLSEVTLSLDGRGNPVCRSPGRALKSYFGVQLWLWLGWYITCNYWPFTDILYQHKLADMQKKKKNLTWFSQKWLK